MMLGHEKDDEIREHIQDMENHLKFLKQERLMFILGAICKTIFQLLFGIVKFIWKLVTGFRL